MMRTRGIAVIPTILMGGLSAAACGSSTKSGSSTPTTAKPSTPTTAAPAPTTAAPTPTTAAPTPTTAAQRGAKADVTITKCAPSTNGFSGPEATVSVVNHSSKTSNYIITVAFESPNGATQLDTGNAAVQNLAAGQSNRNGGIFESELNSQQFVCKVADVTRYASNP